MGAGKRYSAGAIFLQVVPVFNNVQRAIEDEAKNWDRALGDQMEKSGEKAGERAGKAAGKKMSAEMEAELKRSADQMSKALGDVNTRNLGKKLRAEVKDMKSDLESLSDVDLKIDDNFDKVAAKVTALRTQIEAMRKRSKVFFDTQGLPEVYRAIHKLEASVKDIHANVEYDVDTKPVERKMGAFEKSIKRSMDKAAKHIDGSVSKEVRKLKDELDYLSRLRVNVDIGSNQIKRETAEIMADLQRLSQESADIDVRFEAGRAYAELAAWHAAVERADGQEIDVQVDVDTDAASSKLRNVSRDSDQAANSFRSFNGILFAAAGAGPALIPILGGIAAALLAIGPAAAVAGLGIGSVLVGFSGLGDAVSALQNRQDQAAMTAQTAGKQQASAANAIRDAQESLADAERNAARAAEDAADRVKDARKAAADAIENALERQKDAQEAYRDSLQEVKDAEQALREARAEAAGTGHSLDDKIKSNGLAIEQALLDSFDATNVYNATMADGSSTNAEQEQARISMEQAQQSLHELRDQQKELAKEKKKWDKEGVNGTEQVQSAQENLNDAIAAQKDALEDVRDAAEAVDEARVDGAEAVRDAIEAQNETLADNKRAIEDARQALADARQASDDVTESINAQQQAVDNAMNALGPAGRKFALFLFGLREGFREFRDDIQAVMLPSIQAAIVGFLGSSSASSARTLLIALADGFGKFVMALSQSFQGPAWLHFFEALNKFGPGIEKAYGGAFISFMEAMASIMTVLAPYALRFANGLEKMMGAFAGWAASKEGADAIRGFMDYAVRVAPDVLDFLGAFAKAAVAVAVGLAHWGEIALGGLTRFLEFLSTMNPAILSAIVTGLFILITASQTAYAVMNLLMAGGALLTSTVGIWVFAIVGIVAALALLYTQNEDFRNFIKGAWEEIGEAVKNAWDKYLKPAIDDLRDALQELWDEVLDPFFAWLGPVIIKVVKFLLPLLMRWWALVIRGIAWAVRNVLIPVIEGIGATMKWLWGNVVKPTLGFIRKAWSVLVKAMKWVWEHVLRPVFHAIGAVVSAIWKGTLKVVFVLIKAAFKAMGIAMKWVWDKILEPLFGWIADGARWLWRNALKPAFGWIEDGWDGLVRGMKWVWKNILEPVFDYIGRKTLPKLKGAFQTAVDGIKVIWDGLKKVVGSPIKFVLDTIINKGLIAGFNKVAKWVGEDGFDPIPIPKSLQSFATGGVLPGYTPGRDPHKFVSPTGGRLELSGGEAIMRPEFTAALGTGWVDEMNAAARNGGIDGVRRRLMGGQAFAKGGIFFPVRGGYVNRSAYNLGHDGMDINHPMDATGLVPFVSATSGVVSTTGYSRGYGNAVFVRSPYGELVYGHSVDGSIGVSPGESVRPGQYLARIGNTGNSSGPHLHFGFPGGTFYAAESLLAGSMQPGKVDAKGGGGPKVPGWIKGLLKNPLSTIKGWASDTWSRASDFVADSPAFGLVKKVPSLLAGGFKDKVMDFMPGWAKAAAGVIGKAGDVAGDVVGGIKSGVGAVGDAVGLGGYADGGVLPYNGTMMYDNGGYLPPGLTSVVNLTGRPEPVFTADQWDGMEGGGPGGGNIHYEPHFEGSNLTPDDVAADLNFTFRRIRRGGKYEGVGS